MTTGARFVEHKLVEFYLGSGRDDRGRTLEDVLNFSNDQLEREHDFIQWLFPLFERSSATPEAPVLDEFSIATFRRDQRIRRNVRRSLEVMLQFYGFRLEQSTSAFTVVRIAEFDGRAATWLTRFNHNFLRITRILKCLSIVQASALAQAFLVALEDVNRDYPDVIGDTSLEYWRDAVSP